jgi:hypothetical protein
VTTPLGRAALEARSLLALARAGALPVTAPHLLPAMALTAAQYGPFGAAPRLAAMRHPNRPAIADERGQITYRTLDEQVNRLANALPRALRARPDARHPVPQPPRSAHRRLRGLARRAQHRVAEHRLLRAAGRGGRRT